MSGDSYPSPPSGGGDHDWIYDRYNARLLGFAQRRFGSRDAEDIVQETLARCYAGAGRIDLDRDLWPWLRTVAHRIGCDLVRARARDVPVPDGTLETLGGGTERDACDEVVVREEQRMLRAALGRLSPTDRLLLRLREVEELGFDAIGDALGMTANAARQRVFRARGRLGELYDQLDERIRSILVPVVAARVWLRRRAAATSPRTQEYAALLSSPAVQALGWAMTIVVGTGVLGGAGSGGTSGDRPPARVTTVAGVTGWSLRDHGDPRPDPGRPAGAGGGGARTDDDVSRVAAEAGPMRVRSEIRDLRRRNEEGETDRTRIEVDTPLGVFFVETWGWNPPSDDPTVLCWATGYGCDR